MVKKPSGGSSGGKDHRSAETGRYVTEKYSDKHPKTTVSESRPKPTPPGKKGK
ncbi:multidrug transporter [Rhizobium leguminosarum]|uniref:Multidrug transporter n=1 Tax=Rhizobium leguminosarum TaxID=384 RepID=A0ABD7PS98_RHILE|nr:multidrug transporter [Rhizobium leguminosarum]TAV78852.1 multidrug transporter [Rhizobium leguminosarum]TAW30263.1 multidrug transporter [Rhizobium leguminosarum]TAW43989.1 multidrug transporter [Rhizobium leguminosarum]TAX35146.1 multidrug transporter [Rhizobium leguminosarum]